MNTEYALTLKGKKVLVSGMAKSGIAAAKLLAALGADVIASDTKTEEALSAAAEELRSAGVKLAFGKAPDEEALWADMLVMSPGVPTKLPFVKAAKAAGKEVIAEIELAYRLCPSRIAAITGTNGKTTTTSLVGYIMQLSAGKSFVLGNIGNPFSEAVPEMEKDSCAVIEVSSYMLETTDTFKPVVSAILNITPDHLSRHGSMENYIAAKLDIVKSCTAEECVVLNMDDAILNAAELPSPVSVWQFSRKAVPEHGAWVEDGCVMLNTGAVTRSLLPADEIFIKGAHNLENALAAALIASLYGIDDSFIAEGLRTFRGVEHRLESVAEKCGIEYINDSKGTNVDSTIKAIEAMTKPTALILGGFDKGCDFDDLFKAFTENVKYAAIFGATGDKLAETALRYGFTSFERAENLEGCVELCRKNIGKGGVVLLSPACASWDMYESFEHRGRHFKQIVASLPEVE